MEIMGYDDEYKNNYKVTISKNVMIEYHNRLISSIFKALTLFEGKDYITKKINVSTEEALEQFQDYTNNLIFEVSGCKHLFYQNKEFISLLANMVELHRKETHKEVKSLVFTCIDIVERMKGGLKDEL